MGLCLHTQQKHQVEAYQQSDIINRPRESSDFLNYIADSAEKNEIDLSLLKLNSAYSKLCDVQTSHIVKKEPYLFNLHIGVPVFHKLTAQNLTHTMSRTSMINSEFSNQQSFMKGVFSNKIEEEESYNADISSPKFTSNGSKRHNIQAFDCSKQQMRTNRFLNDLILDQIELQPPYKTNNFLSADVNSQNTSYIKEQIIIKSILKSRSSDAYSLKDSLKNQKSKVHFSKETKFYYRRGIQLFKLNLSHFPSYQIRQFYIQLRVQQQNIKGLDINGF